LIGRKENDPEALPDEDIGIEVSNLVFAATDATSTTLTCLFYELARHPELQEHLRNELKSVASVDGFPMHKDLFSLPFLNVAIKESLRHYPPLPSGLPRITPPEGKAIGDVFVPGKVNLAVQYLTYRVKRTDTFLRPSYQPIPTLSITTPSISPTPARLIRAAGSRGPRRR